MHSKTRATFQGKSLQFEPLEERRVLSTVLPFSQLGVTSSGEYPGGAPEQAFSGEGLSGELHSDLWHEGWLSDEGSPADKWLKIDLGGTYAIDYLRVWNGNQEGWTSRGIQQADIYVALSDPGNNVNNSSQPFDPTGWTMAVSDQQFTKSPGTATIANTDPQMSLGGIQAAYLAIRVDSNWGDPVGNANDRHVTLSEMQIYVNDAGITTYPLTVNSGSGDGSYAEGAVASVAADPAPPGQEFDVWAGDTSYLADLLDSTTTFTMPAAAATISASYRSLPPSNDIQTWQIDFEATQPTHPSLFSITSEWDAGFGTKWNTYTNPMRNGSTVPPQGGHTESNLLDATSSPSAVDFSMVSGTTLGMIAGYNGAGIEDTIYSVAREHLFWGGDTNTSDSIGFEFSDLSPGIYNLTLITNAQWHIPHRGFEIAIDGQTVAFHPEAGGSEVVYSITSYKEDFLDITMNNLTVDAAGVLAGILTELEAFSDPSLAGMILTQIAVTPVPDPDADFDNDGDVDGSDFLSWQRGYGSDAGNGNVAPLASGNANGDQYVNGDDQTIWQEQFGQVSTVNSGPANLALYQPVTVSSEPDPTGRPASGATDGVKNIHWRSAAPPSDIPNPWLVVDLGQVYDNIDRVNLSYYFGAISYAATDYDIQVSLDNVNWSVAHNEPNGRRTTRMDNLFTAPVSARYIRYYVNQLAVFNQGVTLDEIQVFQHRPLRELKRRDDAPNFIQKLENGGDVRVAYIGGSITDQDGWRTHSQTMFEDMYPQANIVEIKSTLGGTGTLQALDRLQTTVIDKDPDFVFVEFAVNDAKNAYEDIRGNMEEIVRRIWADDPTTDIAFVYTFRETAGDGDLKEVGTLNSGYYQMSATAFEEVADYYGIPTIHMGKDIAERVGQGELTMQGSFSPTTFSSDGIHPYKDTGHVWYTEALERSFDIIKSNTTPLVHTLPAPMRGGSPLEAASASPAGTADTLASDEVASLLTASIAEWAAAGADVGGLANTQIVVTNLSHLSGLRLGMLVGDTIYLDDDAAGFGWFVDSTPLDDDEFDSISEGLFANAGSEAYGHMDLLSVLSHELGHRLGAVHSSAHDSVMSDSIESGARRRAEAVDLVMETLGV